MLNRRNLLAGLSASITSLTATTVAQANDLFFLRRNRCKPVQACRSIQRCPCCHASYYSQQAQCQDPKGVQIRELKACEGTPILVIYAYRADHIVAQATVSVDGTENPVMSISDIGGNLLELTLSEAISTEDPHDIDVSLDWQSSVPGLASYEDMTCTVDP